LCNAFVIQGFEVVEMISIEAAGVGHVSLARLEGTDRAPLLRFFFRLSPETLYRRFHSPIARPEQTYPERLLDLDHHDREAVVAVVQENEEFEIVGVARYARRPGAAAAEVAVVVADDWQRQGLATRMCRVLAGLAAKAGVSQFNLIMQADNPAVLRLVRRLYPDARLSFSQGTCEAVVPIGA
jgi:GNAT superfamily N-acetyltransferase